MNVVAVVIVNLDRHEPAIVTDYVISFYLPYRDARGVRRQQMYMQ